uniref:Uncharacterized protein n=1 Tax=Spongospora subterranea TaxID=70186 RepID=A0A0H5RD52_9EUKA|eukprot:CRZ11913.1 hypothetical protein [Spongospora subterranea]
MVNDDSPNVGTPAKREIDFRYCIPRPEDRQAVMKFIEESSLFSEARAHGRVEVFTDMIDQILRGGRTLTGSLTTLLELDRNKRNFPNMQALVVSVQQLRNNWDALEDECREFLRQGAALLFANPATTLDPYQISQLVTGTTCGSEIIDRLREEIDLVHTGKPCNGFDELMAVISARQRSRSKARQVKLQAECQAVFLALRLPNLQLFSGFLDLRPNPVFQLLCNGMTADNIIATLESLAADQQTFSDLESMMIAVFKRGTGRDPSILCMGQGSPLARFSSVEDDDEEQKLNGLPAQQALQYKAKAIMTALSNPSIRLFSSVDSNISIKISDISALIQENPSLSSIICNIGLLNAQGRDLLTFAELISLQKDPSLMAAKQEIIDLIQQNVSAIFRHASDAQNMDIATIERLMNATHTHGTIKRILGIVIADDGKNYESLTELSAAIASIHIEQEKQREEETPRIVAWFQSHAIFTIEVELFDSTIDHLVELANGAQRLLQLLQSYEEHAVLFDSLEGLEESILSNIMPNKQLI